MSTEMDLTPATEPTAIAGEPLRPRLEELDSAVDRWFVGLRRRPVVTRSMVRVSNLGLYSMVWSALGLAGLTLAAKPETALWRVFIVAIPLEFILTNGIIKRLFRRSRPIEPLGGDWVVGLRRPRTSSFPSGHASAAAMAAVTVGGQGLLGLAAIALALSIGTSRIFLRLHHPTDVMAGFVWGALLGVTLHLIG